MGQRCEMFCPDINAVVKLENLGVGESGSIQYYDYNSGDLLLGNVLSRYNGGG